MNVLIASVIVNFREVEQNDQCRHGALDESQPAVIREPAHDLKSRASFEKMVACEGAR